MWHLVFICSVSLTSSSCIFQTLYWRGRECFACVLPDWNCVDWIRLSRGIIKNSKSLQNCWLSNRLKEALPHQCGRRWHRRVIAVDILHLSSGRTTKMSYSTRQVSILFYDFRKRALHRLCSVHATLDLFLSCLDVSVTISI